MKFDKNDRNSIEDALLDPNEDNPISVAFEEQVTEFMQEVLALAKERGMIPKQLDIRTPKTVFDDLVVHAAVMEISDVSDIPIAIKWI